MVWSFFSWLILFLAFFFLADIFFWPKAKKKYSAKKKKAKKNTQPRKKTPNHIFFRTCQFTQTETKYTQPKRIYSANGNPFIPMIYRFYAPLLFSNLCAILMDDNIHWYTYRMLVFFWNTQQMNYFRD